MGEQGEENWGRAHTFKVKSLSSVPLAQGHVWVSALERQGRHSSGWSDHTELRGSFTSCGFLLARTSSDHLELNLMRLLSLQLSSNDTF